MGLELAYTDAVARTTGGLYAKVAKVIPEIEWPVHAPLIAEINRLKREKNAVILGHNYMTPEIFHCVSDFVGDSLALAREAARTDAAVIVQAGVHFMAETSKILSPQKTVLIPDARAGCSLAASITGADVRLLRQKHPGVTVLAHPECPPEVVAEADFAGSTAAMIGYVGQHHPARVVMITECSMSDNVAVEYPQVEFVRPCNLCPHMKRITLEGILHSLQTMSVEVLVDPEISARAKVAIDRMLAIKA